MRVVHFPRAGNLSNYTQPQPVTPLLTATIRHKSNYKEPLRHAVSHTGTAEDLKVILHEILFTEQSGFFSNGFGYYSKIRG